MNVYETPFISRQLARRYPINTLTPELKAEKIQKISKILEFSEEVSSELFFAYFVSDNPNLFYQANYALRKKISTYLNTTGTFPFPDPKFNPEVSNEIDIDNLDLYVDYKNSGPELLAPYVAIFLVQQINHNFVQSALEKGGVNPNDTLGETTLLRVATALLNVDHVTHFLKLKADPNLTSPIEAVAKPMAPPYHNQQVTIAKILLSAGASPLFRYEGNSIKEGGYSLSELAEGKDQYSVEANSVNDTLVSILKRQEILQSGFEESYTTLLAGHHFDVQSHLYGSEVTLIHMIAQSLLLLIRSDVVS